jgi:hypothetical protein
MPTQVINIPINSGAREDVDSKLLPQGLFRSVRNGRYRKTGELGVRYGHTALTQNVFGGGTLRIFDVASHGESLIAFGTTNSSANGPEKVFTYSDDTSQWIGEDTGTRPRGFSAISELEQVFRPPFVKTDEDQKYDLAYANGHVALVFEDHTDAATVVHIFDPDTGAILFSSRVTGRFTPRVVGVGSTFVFAWQDSSDDIRAATFVVGSSTALSAETVLHNTGTVGDGVDLCAVSGASEFILLVVRSDTNVCTIRRCSVALAVSATGTLTDTDISLASVVSVSGGRTTVAYVDTSGNYLAESFTTSTLASAVSPASLFGGSTGTRPPGIVRKNSTQIVCTVSIPDTIDSQLKSDLRTESTLVLVTANTFREVSCQSKPFVSPDGQFVGIVSPYGEASLVSFTGIFDVEHGRGYECAHHRGFALDALATWIGSVATDGTRHWAVFPVTDLNCANFPIVMQFKAMSSERRQTASLGGLLYVAGGFVGCFDGQRLVEAGYFDAPIIFSITPSNSTGLLTPLATYVWAQAYDWYDGAGNRHLSPVSDDFTITMGAADDTATIVSMSPHTLRVAQGGDTAAKVITYRTRAAPDRTKRRSVFAFPTGTYAQSVSSVDLASDDEILTQEVVYTQGARGTLSGPLQHEAPFPSQYLFAGRDRITCGGLPDYSQWQRSKRMFPGEPMEWSGTPGHFGNVRGRVTAVFSMDDSEYVATRSEIFVVDGVGPDDLGDGEFASPRKIPGDGIGVLDYRSVVQTDAGTWFQAHPDRLFLLPRGGGAAEWLSQAVRDTLAAFPVIVGSAVVSADNTVVWACQNAAGNAGRLVCNDTRTGDWYVDTLDEFPGVVTAICAHQGRLIVVSGNVAYRQNNSFPAATFIPLQFEIPIAPFGTEGYGKLKGWTTTGKFRAAHTWESEISYDDGQTYAVAGATPFTVSGLAANDTVARQWWPQRRKGDRFVLRFTMGTTGVASEGQTVSNLALEVLGSKKTSRKTSTQRR